MYDEADFKFVATKRGRVFHLASSECGRGIYASNLVRFESYDEALEVGRKPCSRCRPTEAKIDVAVGPSDD